MSLPIIDFSSPNRLATAKVLTEAMETVGFVYLDNVPGFNKEDILCTEQEILNLLIALDTSKASGPDGISGKMLKGTAISIVPVLTEFFNLSICHSHVGEFLQSGMEIVICCPNP